MLAHFRLIAKADSLLFFSLSLHSYSLRKTKTRCYKNLVKIPKPYQSKDVWTVPPFGHNLLCEVIGRKGYDEPHRKKKLIYFGCGFEMWLYHKMMKILIHISCRSFISYIYSIVNAFHHMNIFLIRFYLMVSLFQFSETENSINQMIAILGETSHGTTTEKNLDYKQTDLKFRITFI